MEHLISWELRKEFLALCQTCQTVVCCRVTPLQKSSLVSLIREELGVSVLKIKCSCVCCCSCGCWCVCVSEWGIQFKVDICPLWIHILQRTLNQVFPRLLLV